ncbi:MAG: SRPBCC family protein [Planctomycetota bacterium]|jgi:uncharacterized protein YndB with AHSA1/START domain
MTRIAVQRTIQASPERVFRAVAYVEGLPESNPDVLRIEFLTEQRTGVGTRFRETRAMGKQEVQTDLEITEWDEPRQARMVTEQGGTIWDTEFRIVPAGDGVELTIDMDARPQKLGAKIMLRLIRGMITKGMNKHIDGLVEHCEAGEGQDAPSQ